MIEDHEADGATGGAGRQLALRGYVLGAREVGSTTLRLLAMVGIAMLLILVILPALLRAAGISVVAAA